MSGVTTYSCGLLMMTPLKASLFLLNGNAMVITCLKQMTPSTMPKMVPRSSRHTKSMSSEIPPA